MGWENNEEGVGWRGEEDGGMGVSISGTHKTIDLEDFEEKRQNKKHHHCVTRTVRSTRFPTWNSMCRHYPTTSQRLPSISVNNPQC